MGSAGSLQEYESQERGWIPHTWERLWESHGVSVPHFCHQHPHRCRGSVLTCCGGFREMEGNPTPSARSPLVHQVPASPRPLARGSATLQGRSAAKGGAGGLPKQADVFIHITAISLPCHPNHNTLLKYRHWKPSIALGRGGLQQAEQHILLLFASCLSSQKQQSQKRKATNI